MSTSDPAMTDEMRRTVAELIAEERLREAAALCHAHGEASRAVDLLEQAAAFEEAARVAIEHRMGARALRLIAPFGPDSLMEEAARQIEAQDASSLGRDLAARGMFRAASYALEAGGLWLDAGESWERAGELLKAGMAYRQGKDALRAGRALAARLQQEPRDGRAAFELGRLLLENGKLEAAAKMLQSVSADGPEGPVARALLARVFERMGLSEARASLGEVAEVAEVEIVPGGEGLLFGRYRVQRQAATTPTARVFVCVDRLSERRVAVKVLRPNAAGAEGRDALARFAREARALELLRHPHIVPLLSFLPDGPAVVTPWMDGGSLSELLATTALSPERAIEVALAVLGALGDAHRLGILHRDVKPSNVLLDGAGAPYLADFGAAHVGDTSATMTAGLIGSLAYMAPELLAGERASVQSDLYGAGALLYEAMVGERPAPADQLSVWPSALYPELNASHDEALRRLLSRDPSRRPATAQEAIEQLKRVSFRVTTAPHKAPRPQGKATAGDERRLLPIDDSVALDSTLQRRVRVVEATAAAQALARAFAAALSDALAVVYRLDPATSSVWLEATGGVPLAVAGRALREAEAAALREALGELHRRGVAHGCVDGDHIYLDERRGAVLAFPAVIRPDASIEADLGALNALQRGPTQGGA